MQEKLNKLKRHIKSFVRRHRKLDPNQQKIFNEGWATYGSNKPFKNNNPLALEIGFGMGLTIFNYAKNYPDINFIGVEIHQPGIVSLFRMLAAEPLDNNNIRVYDQDVVLVLNQHIADNSLDKVLIFFPDPWPKKRHNKRRLIQTEFLELLQKKLKSRGILHIATDWEDYANHIIDTIKNNNAFTALNPDNAEFIQTLENRVSTKFEQRGKNKGHTIFDLIYLTKKR